MNNLNKEFWNELEEKNPEAIKVFRIWLRKFQKEIRWDERFPFEFYDLPDAMQIGIFIEFVCERGGCQWEVDLFEMDWNSEIQSFFQFVQETEFLKL